MSDVGAWEDDLLREVDRLREENERLRDERDEARGLARGYRNAYNRVHPLLDGGLLPWETATAMPSQDGAP